MFLLKSAMSLVFFLSAPSAELIHYHFSPCILLSLHSPLPSDIRTQVQSGCIQWLRTSSISSPCPLSSREIMPHWRQIIVCMKISKGESRWKKYYTNDQSTQKNCPDSFCIQKVWLFFVIICNFASKVELWTSFFIPHNYADCIYRISQTETAIPSC